MNPEVEAACANLGWNTLYEALIPGLRPPNEKGERMAISPFPFSNDREASFNVNTRTGLWMDYHARPIIRMNGGNYVMFRALMECQVDADRRVHPDYAAAERQIKVELGLARPVDPAWLTMCQAELAAEGSAAQSAWYGRKPWDKQALVRLGLGWDHNRRRIVIPIYDASRRLVNCRMYLPGGQPKMLWLAPGLSANLVFPYSAWQESWVWLLEGEPDVITARSLGYNGCSGTMGSGNPVPDGAWWHGKTVFVTMDDDEAGREALQATMGVVTGHGATVRPVHLPRWEGMPHNADLSDWVYHMFTSGMHLEQVQREITRLLTESSTVPNADAILDSPPTPTPFATALSTANIRRRLEFDAHMIGRSSKTYRAPTVIGVRCPAEGHSWCGNCVMRNRWRGNGRLELDPRAETTVRSILVTDQELRRLVFEQMQLPPRCPEPRIEVIDGVDVQIAVLGQTLAEAADDGAAITDAKRHEALVVVPPGSRLEDNNDYRMTGFVYALPKTQEMVMLAERFERRERRADSFEMTHERAVTLKRFQPRGDVVSWLLACAEDISAYTGIRGRPDLHLLYRAVWHSALHFCFAGKLVERGWMEALVVGDTRCGKSATFKHMARLYGTGVLIDCKMQTPAGILGAVETSMATGERIAIAGLYPRQDGLGPVCMDEFTMSKWDRMSIMDHMSSTRAEGMVTITKAAKAMWRARVRAIWLANPGVGRLMKDIGGFGVETILAIISQPEDVARFDAAMCVSQSDVPLDAINSQDTSRVQWDVEAHRLLLAWAWSRRQEHVVWADGAEMAVMAMAKAMCSRYDPSIPLVEPAEQRLRIARLCVSIALQCFSTDSSMEAVIVGQHHVFAAGALFAMWYDRPAFGYDRMSIKLASESTVADEAAVTELLDKVLAPAHASAADRMARMAEFDEKVFAIVTGIRFMDVHGTMQVLTANRCIRVKRGTRGSFEFTPAFVDFIRRYITDKARNGG